MGKQRKTLFDGNTEVTTSRPFELLHMDLFGPYNITTLGGKAYAFVIVDDYSRFTRGEIFSIQK